MISSPVCDLGVRQWLGLTIAVERAEVGHPGSGSPAVRQGPANSALVSESSRPANVCEIAAPHSALTTAVSVGDSPTASSAAGTVSQYSERARSGNPHAIDASVTASQAASQRCSSIFAH